MTKKIFIFWICCFLSTVILYTDLLAQTDLKISQQSSAGGRIQEGDVDLIAIFGQPSPVGVAASSDDTVFSGFIYTLNQAPVISLPIISPSPEKHRYSYCC